MAVSAFLDDDNLCNLLDRNVSPAQYENIFDNCSNIPISNFEDDYSLFFNDLNDSIFGYQEPGLGLRQGTTPLANGTHAARGENHEQQPAISNPIQDPTSHIEPILAFQNCLRNDGEDPKARVDPNRLRIEAQIGGRIKIPEQTPGPAASEVGELTFYRRNLFKVSARLYLPQEGVSTLLQQGVFRLVARLDAIESIEGETVKLIKLPIKNDVPAEESTSAKVEPVQPVLLDHRAADSTGQASLAMCWDRLQFRRATTKTRGSVAQRYQLRVTILATTISDQSEKTLAQVASKPIVVRGRSPKNYPDQAKGQDFSVKIAKTDRSASVRRESVTHTVSPEFQGGVIEPAAILTATGGRPDTQFSSRRPTEELQLKAAADQRRNMTAGNIETTDLDLYSDGSEGSSPPEIPSATFAPRNILPPNGDARIPLLGHKSTIAQDWLKPRKAEPPPGAILLPSLRRQSSKATAHDSAPPAAVDTDVDSYEYIPLSINDWSAPVDPVYRPHGVHHKAVKDQYGRSAAKKRYFIDVK
ncbi:uncharacterized protein A1O9_00354 [Exophiala aquamarina CBS 119918]|uniref:NDT80 domain-containing protein n=1 Tax=Exophiala aquamarina CBS 119918 TaxID=1182545 RepID=A0A072PRL6_9EURO|nr:uncharacterized protein A1O9_00354 [Exophiala aquamarina CBS 119918]KEF62382.1 hypothetical protein A1O9_00354 [Exophiala aquamarina CBS 119918]